MSSRRKTIAAINAVLSGYFANAPLKARSRSRPIVMASVKQVTDELSALAAHRNLSKEDFEQRVLRALTKLRDVHTAYTVSDPSNKKIQYLPFQLRRWQDGKRTRYVVSHVRRHELPPRSKLQRGAEVTHWGGRAIDKVVTETGNQEEGAHKEASRALGLAVLTTRWEGGSPRVDDKNVSIRFRLKGKRHVEVFRWESITRHRKDIQIELNAPTVVFPMRQRRIEQLVRHQLFASPKRKAREHTVKPSGSIRLTRVPIPLKPGRFSEPGQVAPNVEAECLKCKHGTFGYVRIRAFGFDADFVEDFRELLGELPQNGLIVDLRESPGGQISHAEEILQLLTSKTVRPTGFRFAATKSTEALTREEYPDWYPSIKRANRARRADPRRGLYSAAFPMTDDTTLYGQRYYGPSVVLVDALTFSAAEMFAAGFLDNRIGSIIGAGDHRTGGAGANVWSLHSLDDVLGARPRLRSNFFKGADLRFSARQCVRISPRGRGFSKSFEGVGITRTISHRLTSKDALNQGEDILLAAARHLAPAAKRARPALEVKKRIVGRRRREIDVTVIGTNITKLRAAITEFAGSGEPRFKRSNTGTLNFRVDRTDTSIIEVTGFAQNGERAHYKEEFVPPQALTDELERERARARRSRRRGRRRRRRRARRARRGR